MEPRLTAPAKMERELTVERTHAGLEVARQLGPKGGRKPKMTDSKIASGTDRHGLRVTNLGWQAEGLE